MPTGALADRFSRRANLVAAGLLQACGFALWTALPSFAVFAAGFVLWGLGGALASGSLEALLYDGLLAAGHEHRYVRVSGQVTAAGLVAQLPAAAVAAVLYPLGGYPLVGWVSVAVCLGAAALATRLPEVRRPACETPPPETPSPGTPSLETPASGAAPPAVAFSGAPRAEVPPAEAARSAAPHVEVPPAEASLSEASRAEVPPAEALRSAAPHVEAALSEASLCGAPGAEVPPAGAALSVSAHVEAQPGEEGELGYFATLRAGVREAAGRPAVRAAVLVLAGLAGLDAIEEYFPLLTHGWGVPTALNPAATLVITLGGALGAGLAARAGRLPGRRLAGLMLAAALLLGGAALLARPAGVVLVAAFYALYRLVLVIADARLQAVIDGAARATITSVAALATELSALLLFGAWALGGVWCAAALTAALAVTLVRPRTSGP